jgi:hypothetical protein
MTTPRARASGELGALVVGWMLSLASASCGSAGRGLLGFGADGGAGDTGTASARDAEPSFPGVADAGDCALTCSKDLHQVLGCNGLAVRTCASDQACAGGACIDACKAAEADQSSIGCDYFTYVPDVQGTGIDDNCFAAFVANTWGSPVTIQVDYAGMPLTCYAGYMLLPSGSGPSLTYGFLGGAGNTLEAGQVAILFLSGGCPGTSLAPPTTCTGMSAPANAATAGTGIGAAFHVSTDRPVVTYDIFPYGAADSYITAATLLLPTSAWDTNYIAADAYLGANTVNPTAPLTPWIAVVSQADGTQVTMSPTAPIAGGGGVAGTGKGVPHTWTINRGQVLQLEQADGSELNGSPIQSSQPVAVFGGTNCMFVPGNAAACDSGHQQIPPVRALGHEYAYARYRDRFTGVVESPPVRVIGAVDGTELTYDPAPPPGAPSVLASRQMVEFSSSGPFVVRSQDDLHPFYMAAYMTGCGAYAPNAVNGNSHCPGDPEFVNVVPPQQFLAQYSFFTDVTYPETELVVVRQKNSAQGFDDVTLDCLSGPVSRWQKVGASGEYETARVDLVTGNAAVGACNNGAHQMHSSTPFGLTVWGWGDFVSYAYPAGANVKPITSVVVPPAPLQ